MTSADPPFYTPGLKLLLQRKNWLMRAGRLDETSLCARRIGITIEQLTKGHLRDVDPHNGLGDLWQRAEEVTKSGSSYHQTVDISADTIHRHYAAISTDIGYEPPPLKQTSSFCDGIVSEIRIFGIHDQLTTPPLATMVYQLGS